MAEKCWCGKELEAVPSGGNPQEFDGAAECSIHGAKYRARPCLCATDYEDGHKRRCSVGGGFDMMAVVAQERFCCGCFVPAWVEVLEAVHLLAKIAAGCFIPANTPKLPEDPVTILRKVEAVLAALDKAKKSP